MTLRLVVKNEKKERDVGGRMKFSRFEFSTLYKRGLLSIFVTLRDTRFIGDHIEKGEKTVYWYGDTRVSISSVFEVRHGGKKMMTQKRTRSGNAEVGSSWKKSR